MYLEIKNTVILEVDENGSSRIVSSDTQSRPIHYAPAGAQMVFTITEAQKKYNYISFPKNSPVVLPINRNITVQYKPTGDEIRVHTHRSQANRCDGMKQILENYNVGDAVTLTWEPQRDLLIFS